MTKRFVFLILLIPVVFSSCYYKNLYYKTRDQRNVLQNQNDLLKKENDSLAKRYIALEENANDVIHQYFKIPMGAIAATAEEIKKFKNFEVGRKALSPNFLYNPINLSPWGNLKYGDCVTAEEAFAKACNNPAIFIPESVAIAWANENGVLEGATLYDVVAKMKDVGFRFNSTTYNDGPFSLVDFRNPSILQNAIMTGPVKLELTGNQLSRAWNYFRRGWFALRFGPEPRDGTNGHCASLCGYGTMSWLAQQFNVPLPIGVDGQSIGYAIFTWGSIGIIDQQSLLNITTRALVRNPTTVIKSHVSSYILKAMGGEAGSNLYLSHADGDIKLHGTYPGGFGEMWIAEDIGDNKILLLARGKETDFINYLSHAEGKLQYKSNREGGEEWIIHRIPNGEIYLEALALVRVRNK